MKRAIGLLSASCLLAAAMVAGPLASSVQGEGVGVGDTPKIEFTALDGTKVNSKYLKDKLVVVDFWATWCGPCVAAMPHMKKIHEKYADDGVQILGISLDRSDAPLKKFIKERELPWPQVRSQAMAQKWGVRGIPSIFIISPEGEVLWNGHPMAMDEPLKKAMAEHLDTEADDDKPQEAEQLTEAQIKQANDALAAAATAAEEGDMETMLRKLEGISTEALASDEVKPNAKKLLESLIQNPKHREALKAAMEENREGALAFSNVARAALPRPERPDKAGAVKVGDKPEFTFATLDGKKVTSESLKGKLVVIDFWATWCGPCMRAMPHMIELNKEYADKGVQVIGVSLDRDADKLKSVIKDMKLDWMHTHDTSRALSKQFGVRGIPSIFIISPEGEVLWNGHPNSMDEPFKKALEEHAPATEQTS